MGKDAMGKGDAMKKDSMGKDSMGHGDAMKKDTMGKTDAMKK
jgi:pentapeptide MXKDX repeat protein